MYHLTSGCGLTLAEWKRMKTNARAVMTKIVSRLVELVDAAQISVTLPRALPRMLLGNQSKRGIAEFRCSQCELEIALSLSVSLYTRVTRLLLSVYFE